MIYNYYTDSTRKLNELGRLFVAMHKKETGEDLLSNHKEFHRVTNECHKRLRGKSPDMKIVMSGYDHETAVRIEIESDNYDETYPIKIFEIAQDIANKMFKQKIEQEYDEMRTIRKQVEKIEQLRRERKDKNES